MYTYKSVAQITGEINVFAAKIIAHTSSTMPEHWDKLLANKLSTNTEVISKYSCIATSTALLEQILIHTNWQYCKIGDMHYLTAGDQLLFTDVLDLTKDIRNEDLSQLMVKVDSATIKSEDSVAYCNSGTVSLKQLNKVPMTETINLTLLEKDGQYYIDRILTSTMVGHLANMSYTAITPDLIGTHVDAQAALDLYGIRYVIITN